MRLTSLCLLLVGLATHAVPAAASGLQIIESEVHREGPRVFADVTLRWDQSWRTNTSWDAAWVFLKARTGHSGWSSLRLLPTGHQVVENRYGGPGATLDVSEDSLGVFVYRDAPSDRGSNHWRIQFALASPPEGADLQVQAFGVEVVLASEGAYWLGDPEASATPPEGPDGRWDLFGAFYQQGANGASGPYRVQSEAAIRVCDGPGSLCYADSQYDGEGDNVGPIPDAFPKGHRAFYAMKYELTQGQYADFLNHLDRQQTANRAIHGARNYARRGRGTIALVGDVYVAARPDRACNYLSWDDGAAWADWAGLRPMTELEYEKLARGQEEPVSGEYAWGSTAISHGDSLTYAGFLVEAEDGLETLSGNANYTPVGADWALGYGVHFTGGDEGFGPLRVGIFETTADGDRERAGAGYYGATELSGSLFERVVSASHSIGRKFEGSHGDGQLSYAGRATNSDWPGMDAEGLGLRGGSFAFNPAYLSIARRSFGAYASFYRELAMGFRAVRTAP
ncbi:MAG: SUMF1/EgtB/PvdO family nonheme iron enzyme [Bacteroidota bacterium]